MTGGVGGGGTRVEVRRGAYADSVTLLGVSRDVAAVEGVAAAQVAMATPLNVEVLADMGFAVPAEATANDLVVALRLERPEDDGLLAQVLAVVDDLLAGPVRSGGEEQTEAPPRTTGSALRRAGEALALVSVPGASAVVEAVDALDAGRDVMVFSDNVPLADEVALKRRATEAGLLVMGPDCGTAVVGGVGLGFANVCSPGPVGIVAASGTGCQQLLALFDHAGVGVTHALGVGGRDLSEEVGGLGTRVALARLDEDPSVELIVLVSKPPAAGVAAAMAEFAAALDTPVELAFLGPGRPDLTAVAESALRRLGVDLPPWPVAGEARTPRTGRWLRGLFVGGTLCDEAMLAAAPALGPIHSNIPLHGAEDRRLGPDLRAAGHTMVDFGDDALTTGRAHPMIDPTLRLEHLGRAGQDPETRVVLLDLVLGHGAEPDPAARLAPAVADLSVPVVVAVVGTAGDPQDRARQRDALVAAGAEVHLSNASAVRRAIELVGADS
jgi:FdrA protein